MPDQISDSCRAAIELIAARFFENGITIRPLTQAELNRFGQDRFVCGWRLWVATPISVKEVDLLVPPDCPWSPPRVAIVSPPKLLTWPHVERDGLLCLMPESAAVDVCQPAQVAIEVLSDAAKLIAALEGGGLIDDFRQEYRTYWRLADESRSRPVYSLLGADRNHRIVKIWEGSKFSLVADDDATLTRWMNHRFGERNAKARIFTDAIFAWLPVPMVPSEFPRSGRQIRETIEGCGAKLDVLLDEINLDQDGTAHVVLGSDTDHGRDYVAMSIAREHSRFNPGSSLLTRGFRPHKIPFPVAVRKIFDGSRRYRDVQRADADWIHGRGHNLHLKTVAETVVGIIGCGSVGSHIAEAVASAGVGRFVLIDPDDLSWSNVGRHALGAEHIAANKAEALRSVLEQRFPHVNEIRHHGSTWQKAIQVVPGDLERCDILVSATGDWASEAALNHWHRQFRDSKTIIYSWVEAHAAAGHAVAIGRSGGCLQCGFSTQGKPTKEVASWSTPTTRQEPACGTTFQAYGPIDLRFAIACAAELVLDCAINPPETSNHVVWVGNRRLVTDNGGAWNPPWSELVDARAKGRFAETRDWPNTNNCPGCR